MKIVDVNRCFVERYHHAQLQVNMWQELEKAEEADLDYYKLRLAEATLNVARAEAMLAILPADRINLVWGDIDE